MRGTRSRAVLAFAAAWAALASIGAVTTAAATAHRGLNYDLGSPPARAAENQLDLYTPAQAAPTASRPVVIYVHGGAWRGGDKSNKIARKVNLFTGAGYVFVSLNYRLSPSNPHILAPGRVKFPAHPHDVGEAVGWLSRHVDEYGGDPSRLLLIGHSAGAHLVSLVSTYPRYVRAYRVEPSHLIGTVSLDTAAFDVRERIFELPAARKDLYYNAFGTPQENAATGSWAAGSPIRLADSGDPRFLLVTQAANARRVAENRRMATALGQNPQGVFLVPYDHAGINDAVGSPNDPAGETKRIMDFFARRVAQAR